MLAMTDPAADISTLLDVVDGGDAILFTGAGFSCDAFDRTGKPLPDTTTMRRELWSLGFPDDEEPDDSTLSDLSGVARSPARGRSRSRASGSAGCRPRRKRSRRAGCSRRRSVRGR